MSSVNIVLRRARRIFVVIAVIVLLAVVAFLFYSSMVMAGDRSQAIKVWDNPAITVTSTDHSVVLEPTGAASGSGLVFIPGAKVDPYAYMYKLSGIVESSGVTVVITKPTLNLAFFDQRPLSLFEDDAPAVSRWFVGGHSLGGVRACQLAASPGAEVAGLVLFGSFCANDLSTSTLEVLSIGGNADGLSTPVKIDNASTLLPAGAAIVQIDGLNHAGFGDYGSQPGDGAATLSSEQERSAITDLLESVLASGVH
ncbi:alpha/beta hydrolase [Salinibacterium sp. G-O1]|uniref:alpha/beta hydrolase n=1 Tax=Salinibacterium sp. G-O1 TaxID=3046208 RepID=UPI0024BA3F1A|nr:alpha/beta hydrolase [Salinibacterium sp. G-O1]MDJ0335604.1 alpha/beta hydrolase [Salinibacterium sp. G-O1]